MSFFKVLVIGEVGVGKTSITNKIVYNTFTDKYKATIGCEFGLKVLELNGHAIRVQLWDLAGQDRLGGSISRLYCRDANGALVVADITNPESIEKAAVWKSLVDEIIRLPNNEPIPMVLCLNKCDLGDEMSDEALTQLCEEKGFFKVMKTSAKDGVNTERALEQLAYEMKRTRAPDELEASTRTAGGAQKLRPADPKAKKGCCN